MCTIKAITPSQIYLHDISLSDFLKAFVGLQRDTHREYYHPTNEIQVHSLSYVAAEVGMKKQ